MNILIGCAMKLFFSYNILYLICSKYERDVLWKSVKEQACLSSEVTKWGGLSGATVNNWCVGHCRCGAIKTRGPSATSLTWESVSINEHILANLWLFHYVDQERKKILSPFENWMVLIWLKLNSLHPRMGLCQVWLNGWN